MKRSKLLLVLPYYLIQTPGGIRIDRQAANGLAHWLKHFDVVDLLAPGMGDIHWPTAIPVHQIAGSGRLRVTMLPAAYTATAFLRHLIRGAGTLSRHIDEADYLHFAIGGLWGDWGSVASLIAHSKRRNFAVWTDRVESEVAAFTAERKSGLRKLYWGVTAQLMRHYDRFIIRRATLGMFHGADCYSAYAPHASSPHLMHNVHVGPEALISEDAIKAKINALSRMEIVYAGRAHREKGIFDWVEVLHQCHRLGLDFAATWYGTGDDLEQARTKVRQLGLERLITFAGAIDDHSVLLDKIKGADIFLFCHKTRESPRCLIEALVCGTPIVGYRSDYSADLIKEHGGGVLAKLDDVSGLAHVLTSLTIEKRADLIKRAALDGTPMNDEAIFRHRSELMKSMSNARS